MNKDILKKIEILEKNARLKLSDEEKKLFIYEYKEFLNSIDEFNKLEVSNIEAVDFPFKVSSSYLREDEIEKNLDTKLILKNSKNVEDNYFVLKKNQNEK